MFPVFDWREVGWISRSCHHVQVLLIRNVCVQRTGWPECCSDSVSSYVITRRAYLLDEKLLQHVSVMKLSLPTFSVPKRNIVSISFRNSFQLISDRQAKSEVISKKHKSLSTYSLNLYWPVILIATHWRQMAVEWWLNIGPQWGRLAFMQCFLDSPCSWFRWVGNAARFLSYWLTGSLLHRQVSWWEVQQWS